MNRHSFTLVELMITAAVLIVALLGVLAIFDACFNLSETARKLTIATNGAQSKLEEILPDSACTNRVAHVLGFNNTTFEIEGLPDADSEGVVYASAITNNLAQVWISVSWRQKGNRIVGEDLDLDGAIDTGEDANGNGRLDSPARLTTLISDWP